MHFFGAHLETGFSSFDVTFGSATGIHNEVAADGIELISIRLFTCFVSVILGQFGALFRTCTLVSMPQPPSTAAGYCVELFASFSSIP